MVQVSPIINGLDICKCCMVQVSPINNRLDILGIPGEMVLSVYEKQRILFYHLKGFRPSDILSAVKTEGIITCWQTVSQFIK